MTKGIILAAVTLSLVGGCSTVELVPMTNPDTKAAVECTTPIYNEFWGPFAGDLRIENECIAACRRHGFRTAGQTGPAAEAGPGAPLSEEAAALTPDQCKP